MGQPLLGHLEGDGGGENGAAVLLGHHPPGGKAPAIANRVHLVDDLLRRIPGAQEIAVQGVGDAAFFDRAHGGIEGLRQHLAAKDARRIARALADKEVLVYGLDFQVTEQFFEFGRHG